VQFGAGLRIHRRPGEPVAAGEPLFTLYTDTPDRFAGAVAELDDGWSVGDTPPERDSSPESLRSCPWERPLIIDRITHDS
jgi:thymidine phosphorylase